MQSQEFIHQNSVYISCFPHTIITPYISLPHAAVTTNAVPRPLMPLSAHSPYSQTPPQHHVFRRLTNTTCSDASPTPRVQTPLVYVPPPCNYTIAFITKQNKPWASKFYKNFEKKNWKKLRQLFLSVREKPHEPHHQVPLEASRTSPSGPITSLTNLNIRPHYKPHEPHHQAPLQASRTSPSGPITSLTNLTIRPHYKPHEPYHLAPITSPHSPRCSVKSTKLCAT